MSGVIGAQHGLDDLFGDDGHQDSQQESGEHQKKVVGHGGDGVIRNQDTGGLLGDGGHDGVHVRDDKVSGEAAGDRGQHTHHTSDGVLAVAVIDDTRDGHQHQGGGGGGQVSAHAYQHKDGDQDLPGGVLDHLAQGDGDQAGAVRHADAQEHHQHHTQGGIADDVADEVVEHIGDAVPAQQIVNFYGSHLHRAAGVVIHFSCGAPAEYGANHRQNHNNHAQDAEQGHGLYHPVANALHRAKEPAVSQPFAACFCIITHRSWTVFKNDVPFPHSTPFSGQVGFNFRQDARVGLCSEHCSAYQRLIYCIQYAAYK